MQNQNNTFELLTEEACSTLDLSYQAVKDKYKDYPICLMQYIEKDVNELIVEVRFDTHLATISLSFDPENNCNGFYLFLDNPKDEDSFIEYLNTGEKYDFKCSHWAANNYFIKLKPSKYETAFCFYR